MPLRLRREKVNKRLKLTALNELGCKLKFSKKPIAFNELHLKQKNRSHFISMLYKCKIIKGPKKKMKYKQIQIMHVSVSE